MMHKKYSATTADGTGFANQQQSGQDRNASRHSRLDEPVSLSQIFPHLYKQKQWQQAWLLVQLSRDWPRIVGAQVASLTRPAWLRHDVLWIYVQNSAWIHHLQMIKMDLLTQLRQSNKECTINDIRCMMDPVQAEDAAMDHRMERKLETPCPPQAERLELMRQLTEGIEDPDCRRALNGLWQRWLDRQT